ncbi:MAG: hypothetical protein IIC71_13395 [Acidobacteria bacterium]|nr:hypothetical protein [Acidobacteriota bacterium]
MNSTEAAGLSCCCSARTTTDRTLTGSVTESNAIARIRDEEMPADVAAVRSAGFRLLFETGEPVAATDLANGAGISANRATEILDSFRTKGRAEFDDRNFLIGIAGLTLTPSNHEFTIDGRTRQTWCALDAVGILSALEATGSVRSTDPYSGVDIEIAFADGRPATNVKLFVLEGFDIVNVREDWCPQVNFFTTHSAAEKWATSKGLDGDIVAVPDILEAACAIWKPVVAGTLR